MTSTGRRSCGRRSHRTSSMSGTHPNLVAEAPLPWSAVPDAAVLERFSAPTRAWFTSTFPEPTEAQAQGWDAISEGRHTLILAPTGSGKTLSAFLWTLDRLLTRGETGTGTKVLYVSPLKALSYDVERNLRAPLAGIAMAAERAGTVLPPIKVATRTGDTPQVERRALMKHPPDILITTPESLYLMLTSNVRETLASVEHVIIDEIHAMAASKRGAHLALSLERLERLCEHPPQRIGLSATQRPLEELARYLGGQAADGEPRKVTIVDAGVRKPLELQIVVPVEDMGEVGRSVATQEDFVMSGPAAGNPEARTSIWPSIHPILPALIRAPRSTLIFVNSRRLAERLANRLNDLAAEQEGADHVTELVRAHHGSIAREQRL